ncbi:MAG: GH92 family glycosyl hydrolase [Mycoplasmataceae bacterium]|nr:GH92 family glycosyl hydrolase [Mycoplasmataceae bacterium]
MKKSFNTLTTKSIKLYWLKFKYLLNIWIPITACFICFSTAITTLNSSELKKLSATSGTTGTPFYASFETDEALTAKTNVQYTSPTGFSNVSTTITSGPTQATRPTNSIEGEGFNIANQVGFTGLKSYQYQATVATNNSSQKKFENIIFGTDQLVNDHAPQIGDHFVLSYKIFPSLGVNGANPNHADNNYASSYISLDLLYNDSPADVTQLQRLSDLNLKDQYGYGITPKAQGDAKILYAAQWNSKIIDLSAINGKYIHSILLTYDYAGPDVSTISGYIDDLEIKAKLPIDGTHLTNYVDTRRGTNSGELFSRGNNIPATSVPNGFNFYTPMTNANSDWLYSYKANTNSANLPTLNGIGISHEPSPWMGDREQFHIMPSIASNIDPSPSARALPFKHENEIAQPDYYAVTFENNIKTEIAPSSHSAIFRITFPDDTSIGTLIFDSRQSTDSSYSFNFDTVNRTFSGFVDNKSSMSTGASKMFIYATFNQTFTHEGTNNYISFNQPNSQNPILMNIATSYISIMQAEKSLNLEVGNQSFEQLHHQATQKWNERLKVIDLSHSNATDVQKQTTYSNLYRLNLYPNEYFENTGDNNHPIYEYKSPVIDGNPIRPGKMYVNNGFWDTYRTVWPAYSLLYPNFTRELVDGFLYQYVDGGYVARWSSPGYADSMTGTSSDAAFADAYVSGAITDLNTALNIYNSGMKDAFTCSQNPGTGRKGLNYASSLGYTPYLSSPPSGYSNETVSWTLEGYINDYALSQMASKLANDPKLTDDLAVQRTGETKQQILNTANYLLRRSENFGTLFDHDCNFFRAKDLNGDFILHGSSFNPLDWGYEFTETNAWNYAFSVPFDVPGLAYLYGGQNELLSKLDLFFNTPELATHKGSYWTEIHEMIEARDVRIGQLGMSNQPSHHIPYMYAAAGVPSKTQSLTREILQRLYIGSDIGQGYCGDEDNGEMSAWYILSSLGIYDLALASGKYIITAPLFNKVIVTRDNDEKLTITADNNSSQNKYIAMVSLDNKPLNDVYLPQDQLLGGNHTLSFNMSPTPTNWGAKTIIPTSPNTVIDVTNNGVITSTDDTDVTPLTNHNSNDMVNFSSRHVTLFWQRKSTINNTLIINMLMLTSTMDNQKFNTIKILGSDDAKNWKILATYNNQNFPYAQQTREFSFDANKNYQNYQIQLTMDTNVSLAELQLLESDYQPYQHSTNNQWIWIGITIGITVFGTTLTIITVWRIKRNRKKLSS